MAKNEQARIGRGEQPEPSITVHLEFEEDRERCVKAILRVLGYQSPHRHQEQETEQPQPEAA